MIESELKPCRCGCGGEAEVHVIGDETGTLGVYVVCEKCLTQTEVKRTEAEAITAWNRAMGNRDCLSRDHCKNCGKYDQEHHYCPEFCDVIRDTVDDLKAQYPERTAKVETVEKPNVFKCSECGQYFHSTAWGSPVEYCSRCGAKLDWSGNESC